MSPRRGVARLWRSRRQRRRCCERHPLRGLSVNERPIGSTSSRFVARPTCSSGGAVVGWGDARVADFAGPEPGWAKLAPRVSRMAAWSRRHVCSAPTVAREGGSRLLAGDPSVQGCPAQLAARGEAAGRGGAGRLQAWRRRKSSSARWTRAGSRTPTLSATSRAVRPSSSTGCAARAIARGGRKECVDSDVLRTHAHPDHVAGEDEVVRRSAPRWRQARSRPAGLRRGDPCAGHSDDGVSFLVNGELLFSGDTLFRDAVGGGPADEVRDSVMELMDLPPATRVLPGHTDETTIGRDGTRTRSSATGEARRPRWTSPCESAGDAGDPHRLVARLRRQGQGARPLRGRRRGDRGRLSGGARVVADGLHRPGRDRALRRGAHDAAGPLLGELAAETRETL